MSPSLTRNSQLDTGTWSAREIFGSQSCSAVSAVLRALNDESSRVSRASLRCLELAARDPGEDSTPSFSFFARDTCLESTDYFTNDLLRGRIKRTSTVHLSQARATAVRPQRLTATPMRAVADALDVLIRADAIGAIGRLDTTSAPEVSRSATSARDALLRAASALSAAGGPALANPSIFPGATRASTAGPRPETVGTDSPAMAGEGERGEGSRRQPVAILRNKRDRSHPPSQATPSGAPRPKLDGWVLPWLPLSEAERQVLEDCAALSRQTHDVAALVQAMDAVVSAQAICPCARTASMSSRAAPDLAAPQHHPSALPGHPLIALGPVRPKAQASMPPQLCLHSQTDAIEGGVPPQSVVEQEAIVHAALSSLQAPSADSSLSFQALRMLRALADSLHSAVDRMKDPALATTLSGGRTVLSGGLVGTARPRRIAVTSHAHSVLRVLVRVAADASRHADVLPCARAHLPLVTAPEGPVSREQAALVRSHVEAVAEAGRAMAAVEGRHAGDEVRDCCSSTRRSPHAANTA